MEIIKGKKNVSRSPMKDLTVGSPMKLILGFAAPLLFGFLFQQFYSFVDAAIVGRYLGSRMLAAVGATGAVNFLVLGFCQGSCAGFAIPIAKSFGAKDEVSLRQFTANIVYVCAAIGLTTAVLTGIFCPQILQLMNTDPEILADSTRYIRIIFLGIPVTMLYNMAGGILRSLGDSKTPVFFLAVASLVNVALDIVLILYVGMGVEGAAIATVISQLISGVGCLLVMRRSFPILKLSPDDWRFRKPLCKKLLSIGAPMGLQYSITAIGSVTIQAAVNGLGVTAVASITASSKLTGCLACVFDALATTMATFAGQNMGARKLNRINQGLKAASIIGVVYCVLAFVFTYYCSEFALGLFVDKATDPEVMTLARQYCTMCVGFFIPLLFVNIVRLSIQGMGFTKIAMIAGFTEMIARCAVAFFVVPLLGFDGACFSNPAAWILADAFLFPCYFFIMRGVRERLG